MRRASIEADVTFYADPDNEKSDSVDMHIGEDSAFHDMYGYYAQGVNIEVAHLPAKWRSRIVVYSSDATEGARGHCLEAHDLVVSKLVAGRAKDVEFASALLLAGLVSPRLLVSRAAELEVPAEIGRVTKWVAGWVAKHAAGKPDQTTSHTS